ncbi:MAG TPA: hypothetical protein VFD51_00945 [Patescibacteria group bacterium]|nr:hypothetical protein [Patescibacteria group bacterium]
MGIEYLSGIVPGGKIDLTQFESKKKMPSPEIYLSDLKIKLNNLSNRLNNEYEAFLDKNGQVEMIGDDEDACRTLISNKESLWANDSGLTKEAMLVNREKNPANIAEIATTLLFDKVLSEDFIIVRASTYDDYENGADQLIIDKETGAVICGLDDAILGESVKDTGEKKALKIDKKMKSGGAQIKFGLTVNNGALERKNLSHIPIFYFNLNKSEMNMILKSLSSNISAVSTDEQRVYNQLINSLLSQASEYEKKDELHPKLKDNLKNFTPSLIKMQNHII